MNTPQPHKSDAHCEEIRCRRNKAVLDALVQAGNCSMLAKPSWKRWNRAMLQIEAAMIQLESEMEAYYDQHPKRWRNGRPGYEHIERLTELQLAKDAITAWLE